MHKKAELSTTFIILIVIGLVIAAIVLFVTGKGAKSVQDTIEQTCEQLGGTPKEAKAGAGCPVGTFPKKTKGLADTQVCCVNPLKDK
tara:strand:+ start:959 stop:1219 length:261 start_codon:yes stop_codon:yes gene_type:complete